jgi:hypothetical protein
MKIYLICGYNFKMNLLNTILTNFSRLCEKMRFQVCPVEWVDVGPRPKVRWIFVVFHKKIRKIEKKFFIN